MLLLTNYYRTGKPNIPLQQTHNNYTAPKTQLNPFTNELTHIFIGMLLDVIPSDKTWFIYNVLLTSNQPNPLQPGAASVPISRLQYGKPIKYNQWDDGAMSNVLFHLVAATK